MKIIYLVLAALILSGCYSAEKRRERLNAWIGKDASALVEKWGYPDQIITAPNGNTVYTYVDTSSYTTPVNTTSSYNQYFKKVETFSYGGQTQINVDKTFFEINSSSVIVKWSSR